MAGLTCLPWLRVVPIAMVVLSPIAIVDGTNATHRIDFITTSESRAVLLNSDVMLNCSAVYLQYINDTWVSVQNEPLFYQWYFQTKPIEYALGGRLVFHNHSLFIPSITQDQLGRYKCQVWPSNDPLKAVSSPVISIVEAYIGEFVISPSGVTVDEGTRLSLYCVTGLSAPPANIYWEKDGVKYPLDTQSVASYGEVGAGGAQQQTLQLSITAIDLTHAGMYRCVAVNPLNLAATHSQNAVVLVKPTPKAPIINGVTEKEMTLPANASTNLSCPITGWPRPQIQWFKDGFLLVNDSRISVFENGMLWFSAVERSDEGFYYCVGVNNLGSVGMDPVNISIAYLEVDFAVYPVDTSVLAGQELTLSCEAPPSFPPALIQWYHDGVLLSEEDGEFPIVISDGDIYFRNAQMTDSGVYVCVALNSLSQPSSRNTQPVYVNVSGSATLLEPPVAQRLVKGDLLRLVCRATGTPFPSLAWYRNSEPIVTGERISLSIDDQELIVQSVSKLDEGLYHCTASNTHGAINSSAVQISVLVAPEVVTPASLVAATEGASVHLPCLFHGDPIPRVTWFQDEEAVDLQSPRLQVVSNGLNITHLVESDAGVYRCVGTNEAGTKSTQASLIVQVPPSINSIPATLSITSTQTLLLYCNAIGNPEPSVSWLYNDTVTLPDGVSVSEDGRRLEHLSPVSAISGRYTCLATNLVGRTTRAVEVFIKELPQIDIFDGNLQVDKGADLDLFCHVLGSPLPTILFLKKSQVVVPTVDGRITLPESGRLKVRFVVSSDGGEYTCRASNSVGYSERRLTVTIQVEPAAPVLQSASPVSATSINVTWSAPDEEILSYTLQYKLGYAAEWQSRITSQQWLEVEGLSPASHYVFRLAANNNIGASNFSHILGASTYQTAPGPPAAFSLLHSAPNTLLLQWEQPTQTNGQIAMYQLQHAAKFSLPKVYRSIDILSTNTLRVEYSLTGLTAYTSYECRVRAGVIRDSQPVWGEFTQTLTFTTAMTAPTEAPGGVNGTATSSRSLHLSWQPITADLLHGPLLGYIVRYRQEGQPSYNEDTTLGQSSYYVIDGLLPWQLYEVEIAGYNAAGKSVFSQPLKLHTLPEVPSGAPVNVQARAISPTEILVQWQEVPVYQQNCDLSGYMLVYHAVDQPRNINVLIPSPHITHRLLPDLSPWTEYRITIQAFTTQIQDGFGPFSDPVSATTQEDLPGIVEDLTVEPFATYLLLSWDPPKASNGKMLGYIVTFRAIASDQLRKRRQTMVSVKERSIQLPPHVTQNVRVSGLKPESWYRVSVVGRNGAGRSHAVNVTVLTEPLQSTALEMPSTTYLPVTHPTTTPPLTVMPRPHTDMPRPHTDVGLEEDVAPATDSGLSTGELVGLGVGVALAAVLLVVLIILLVVWCYRRQRQQNTRQARAQSFRQDSIFQNQGAGIPSAVSQQADSKSGASSTITGSDGLQSSNTSTSDNTKYSTNPSIHRNIPTSTDNYSTSASAGGVSEEEVEARKRRRMVEGYVSEAAAGRHKHTVNLKHRSHGGIDNPAYDAVDGGLGFRRPFNSLYDLPSELRTSSRRLQHMGSNTAAAIATQRNLDTNVFADTDVLLDTDRVVIYNERTAL